MNPDQYHHHVIPGGGWMIRYVWEDGAMDVHPVVGWAITFDKDGDYCDGFPIDSDVDGQLGRVSVGEGASFVIFHPDEESAEAPTEEELRDELNRRAVEGEL